MVLNGTSVLIRLIRNDMSMVAKLVSDICHVITCGIYLVSGAVLRLIEYLELKNAKSGLDVLKS